MRRFNYKEYSEEEHVIVSENGMTFFYNVDDDSGWWGERVMLTAIKLGTYKSDVFGFSGDGICEFRPGSGYSNAFFLGSN